MGSRPRMTSLALPMNRVGTRSTAPMRKWDDVEVVPTISFRFLASTRIQCRRLLLSMTRRVKWWGCAARSRRRAAAPPPGSRPQLTPTAWRCSLPMNLGTPTSVGRTYRDVCATVRFLTSSGERSLLPDESGVPTRSSLPTGDQTVRGLVPIRPVNRLPACSPVRPASSIQYRATRTEYRASPVLCSPRRSREHRVTSIP